MLHTKSQGHRPTGSGEEDFLRVFTVYVCGGHLGHVTKTIWTNFRSPSLRSLHMKYEFNWPSSFREGVWKCWRTTDDWRRTDAGRTPDARVTGILLAHQWAFGSGELINKCYKIRKIYLHELFALRIELFAFRINLQKVLDNIPKETFKTHERGH